ncbi:MAG: hypothetical protein U0414_03010 [Polyangiaceae bacterium]
MESTPADITTAAVAAPGGAGGNGGPMNMGGTGADGLVMARQKF